jgi:hypothetical protein
MHLGQRVGLTRVGVALVLFGVLAIGLTVWDLRRVALADALVATDNLAIVLAAQTGRSMQSVDIVLRDVQERIAALGVGPPAVLSRGILCGWGRREDASRLTLVRAGSAWRR